MRVGWILNRALNSAAYPRLGHKTSSTLHIMIFRSFIVWSDSGWVVFTSGRAGHWPNLDCPNRHTTCCITLSIICTMSCAPTARNPPLIFLKSMVLNPEIHEPPLWPMSIDHQFYNTYKLLSMKRVQCYVQLKIPSASVLKLFKRRIYSDDLNTQL